MLRIEINKEHYDIWNTWSDPTLSKIIELGTLVNSCPAWLKDLHCEKETELTELQATEFDVFVKKVIGIMSNIPINIVYQTSPIELMALYNSVLFKFVYGCMFYPDFKPAGITKFEHKGETYYLPSCDKDVVGEPMPCVNISALELCESTDLQNAGREMESGNYTFAANIISILCRKKNEPYDENVCKDRANVFLSLPMGIVLEVFFCLDQLMVISNQSTQISTLRERLKKKAIQP